MYAQLSSRELGGFTKYRNKTYDTRWQTPHPPQAAFLERLEAARLDQVSLTGHFTGFPIVCQFGRGANSHWCAVTDEDGQVWLLDTKRPRAAEEFLPNQHGWEAHKNAVFDYTWINNDSQCLTAAGDQTVALWDLTTFNRVTTFMGHTCSVRSVASCPNSTVQFASGARDGHIMLWDMRVNKQRPRNGHEDVNMPVKAIKYAHGLVSRANLRRHRRLHRASGPKGVMDTQQSVTCVLYQTENVLISSGANDGCVKIWDTRKWYTNSSASLPQPLHTFQYPGHMRRLKGIVTMCLDPWRSQLFVSYTDSIVYRFQVTGTYKKEPEEYVCAGHRNDSFFARSVVSPDGKYLLTGSGRNTGIIWEVDRPEKRPMFLVGHNDDVTAVDWCQKDVCKLATLSDDMKLKIWRPALRQRDTEDPTIVGFAYYAEPGKVCRRQALVHIVQDEFPFSLPTPTASPSVPTEGQSPTPRSAPRQWSEPSMRQVFWASCQKPRRSPRKLTKENSAGPSIFPLLGEASSQRSISPGDGRKGEKKVCTCGNRNRTQESLGSSPQSTAGDNAEYSPCTPKRVSSPLPFTSYALRSIVRDSAQSPSRVNAEQSPHRGVSRKPGSGKKKEDVSREAQVCKSPASTRSPRECSCQGSWSTGLSPVQSPRRRGLTPVKSPKKLFSPSKSPHKCATASTPDVPLKPRRQLFSSPTACLPNSVLDPPQKPATPPPTPTERKVDWLTQYRMAKSEIDACPTYTIDASPGTSSSSKPCPGESPASSGKGGSRNSTPKRKLCKNEQDSEVTPGKKQKLDRTPTPTRRSSSFSKPGMSSRTPRRKAAESPKTPTNMSIKRYLQIDMSFLDPQAK